MDKLRIFLAGPMTGYENFNFCAFNFIENVLKQYGVDVVNPVHICKKYKKAYEYYRDIYAADIVFADLNRRMMVPSKAIKYKKEHEKK